jgi:uncharacterized protein YukE
MTLIHVHTANVADAAHQINQAAAATEQNHAQSLSIVQSNADNFGGRGHDAFHQAISTINNQYQQHKETIAAARQALAMANDGFTETDGQMAAQYG